MLVKERLTLALAEALRSVREAGEVSVETAPPIRLDVPPSAALGDFSSDLALAVSRVSGRPAVRIAEALAASLRSDLGLVERVDVSSAGFLNLHLKPGWLEEVLREARTRRGEFGRSDVGAGKRVQVEFVSAYPTAPLNVLHGRGAAIGDALSNVLAWSGWSVTREFYVNDAGSRFERFARSVEAEYLTQCGRENARPPADGFRGEYLTELVQEIRARVGDQYLDVPAAERQRALSTLGRDAMLDRQRATLAELGVRLDEWRLESELLASGRLDEAVRRMSEKGLVYEADGALWLRSTSLGDEMDRPLRRGNGETTYLAGDLAYHLDKFERGFERVIDIWGPDHQTYVRRTLIGIEGLGYSPRDVDFLVLSPVAVKIDGGRVDSTAVGGNNLLLAEVIAEVGRDAARFFYLLPAVGATLELDLDRARREPESSPAQRVRSTYNEALRLVSEGGAAGRLPSSEAVVTLPAGEREGRLARRLADFPDEVRLAGQELDPGRIARYAVEITDSLNPVLAAASAELPTTEALALIDAATVVLGNALEILTGHPEGADKEKEKE